jgi:hypothetical protein
VQPVFAGYDDSDCVRSAKSGKSGFGHPENFDQLYNLCRRVKAAQHWQKATGQQTQTYINNNLHAPTGLLPKPKAKVN